MVSAPLSYLGGLVQISTQRPAIPTKDFHRFLQSLQEDTGILPYIRPKLLPAFPIHYSLSSYQSSLCRDTHSTVI
jgi:hypothetical protein